MTDFNGPEQSEEDLTPEDRTARAADAGAPGGPEASVWDREDAIANLKMDRTVQPDLTAEQMTRKMLEDAAPMAAASIIHIALHSGNDNTRFNAAKYITDKVYDDAGPDAVESWEKLLADTVDQAELFANSPQHPGTQ